MADLGPHWWQMADQISAILRDHPKPQLAMKPLFFRMLRDPVFAFEHAQHFSQLTTKPEEVKK